MTIATIESRLRDEHEFHAFEVDAAIVNDLIYRQNGTISTALRELVMNAFDANSEKVELLIWAEGFDVKDVGDGFEDESSIMRNFKRFGTPHKEGDAKYGRFRIGRGQVMAFAQTTWHSKTYQMITDVRSKDAGFLLKKDVNPYDGCHVYGEFYTPLDTHELLRAIEDVTKLVRYSPWPVFINQIQVNVQDGVVWDYEDDKLKISFNPKGRYGINLYSLGILVKELQMYRYGITADVVTKQALQLNMARNEINENDPLWRHVHNVLREELRKRQGNKSKLTESERQAVIDQFHCKEIGFCEIAKLPLLKDVRGKPSSFYTQLAKKRPWTVSEENQARIADTVSTRGNAFVLPRSELDIWRVKSIDALISTAKNNLGDGCEENNARFYRRLLSEVEVAPFEKISAGVNDQYALIPLSDLTEMECAQRNALQYTAANMSKRLEKLHGEPIGKRKLHIGVSHSVAWTDSSTYIAFNRKTLSLFDNGMQGLTQLVAILLHELTHRDGSISSNGHDMAFYENFHDAVICASIQNEVLGNAITSLRNQYTTELTNRNLPFPKWMAERDQSSIQISLLGSAPTPLLTWFLNLVELQPVKGRGKIELNASSQRLQDLRGMVDKRVDAMLRKHGLPVEQMTDFDHLSDYAERAKKYAESRLPNVKIMLAKEGLLVTDLAAKILSGYTGFSRRCQFGGLTALAEDEGFGVKSLHKEYRRNIKIMAGKGFSYSSNFRDDWRDRDMTAESLADGGKEARFAHYRNVLEELVDGITDPAEKEEFLDRAFSDNMRKSLNEAKK
ncbi:MAG: ATP-binding protein [bacterium]|nr:ATP-binding protein [bacterium]